MFITALVFTSLILGKAYSQIGIGTNSPAADAILDLSATNKALVLTRVTSVGAIANPVNGMIVYDELSKCVRVFENGDWGNCLSGAPVVNNSTSIPSSITLAQNSFHLIASIYDQDYLPFTTPTQAASLNSLSADGTFETNVVDIQGKITSAGITVKIPVIASGNDILPAYSKTISIPGNMTEDGVSRNLTLSWESQSFNAETTNIIASIKSVGGDLNIKKLDINSGIGSDFEGFSIGQFAFPYNSSGSETSFNLKAIAAIPDKMYGLPDNNGDSTTHKMLYLPVVGEDGKIWLNNNLGAHYANINHNSFNLTQQANDFQDHFAYGSLFQWGRKPDGHELVQLTDSNTGTPVNGTTTTVNDDPTDSLFIIDGILDWRITQDDLLWSSVSSPNNPCPDGFRLPTKSEFDNLFNGITFESSTLKFSHSGYRSEINGSLFHHGFKGWLWTNTTIGSDSYVFILDAGETQQFVTPISRIRGHSVRCIKE